MPPKWKEADNAIPAPVFSPARLRSGTAVLQPWTGTLATSTTAAAAARPLLKLPPTSAIISDTVAVADMPHPHEQASLLIAGVLKHLETMYQALCKTQGQTTSMKKGTLEDIGTKLQQAYKYIQKPCQHPPPEATTLSVESIMILDALTHIQQSVTNLEAKINQNPKTYADIIKKTMSPANGFKDVRIEQRTQKR